jgi:hypothetical protein
MARRRNLYPQLGTDQQPLYISRKSFAGGQNTRINASSIGEDEVIIAYNTDLSVPGQVDKRPGLTLIANDSGGRTLSMSPYYPTGGTNAIYLVETTNVKKWTGSGNWSSALYSSLTTGLDTSIIQGGESGENEVLFLQNGSDTPLRINSSDTFQDLGSGGTAPPKTLIQIFFNNRWWVLLNGFLYYSDTFSTDYSTAFSSSNGFRFSGYGADRGLFSIRSADTTASSSIIVGMQNAIFGIAPSATPVSTDRPYIITTQHGMLSRKCISQMGDDIAYLAPDGIRSLKRTVNDQLQVGVSYPLSYRLKDEFENINWSQSSKFHMTFWQDKLFFFFAAVGSSEINRCWIYWPALDNGTGKGWAVMTGWAITATSKFFVSGQENLYGGSADGTTYQIWKGGDDNGTAISLQLETRDEDFGQPAIYKSGGEVEVVAESVSGAYSLTVYASIDGGDYITLGSLTIQNASPQLPINLPFNLVASARVSKKFHLDALGRFRRIKFKVTNADNNGSDIIRLYEINATTYPEAYEAEV